MSVQTAEFREVQASEAKAKWAEILTDVERGETVILMRHGKPVARLVPEAIARQREVAAAIESIRSRMGPKPVNVEELLSARDEGRRY
jgi:prevent-host-death family protein